MVSADALGVFGSPSEAEATACLVRLPDEDEDECKECDDGFDRREKVARAAVVFSRATAKESRLCLGVEVDEVWPSESRELDDCVTTVGEILRGDDAYSGTGWVAGVLCGMKSSRSCRWSGGFRGKTSVESGCRMDERPPVM